MCNDIANIGLAQDTVTRLQHMQYIRLDKTLLRSISPLCRALEDTICIFNDGTEQKMNNRSSNVLSRDLFALHIREAEHHMKISLEEIPWYSWIIDNNVEKKKLRIDKLRQQAQLERPELHDGFYAFVIYLSPKNALVRSLARVDNYAIAFANAMKKNDNRFAGIVDRTFYDVAMRKKQDREHDGFWSPIDLARSMTLILARSTNLIR